MKTAEIAEFLATLDSMQNTFRLKVVSLQQESQVRLDIEAGTQKLSDKIASQIDRLRGTF